MCAVSHKPKTFISLHPNIFNSSTTKGMEVTMKVNWSNLNIVVTNVLENLTEKMNRIICIANKEREENPRGKRERMEKA